jgi:DNA-binding response OmpR family regulator
MTRKPLANCRIFYLEDDYYIADETRERLAEAGADVVLCGSVRRAMDTQDDSEFDLALLDLNISGTLSVPVARFLKHAGVPILFLTGYARDILPADLSSCALLTKPVNWTHLVQEMQTVLSSGAVGD